MANFKACISNGCEADTDTEKWEVAGISPSGKVEWWCVECAQKLTVQHKSLDAARLARQSEKGRVSQVSGAVILSLWTCRQLKTRHLADHPVR